VITIFRHFCWVLRLANDKVRALRTASPCRSRPTLPRNGSRTRKIISRHGVPEVCASIWRRAQMRGAQGNPDASWHQQPCVRCLAERHTSFIHHRFNRHPVFPARGAFEASIGVSPASWRSRNVAKAVDLLLVVQIPSSVNKYFARCPCAQSSSSSSRSATSRKASGFSTTIAPCSSRTQPLAAQATSCLLVLSREIPTISLSCC
jgi:hypothetical protein